METLLLLERPGFAPLQSKLVSTSEARRSKLWRWILSTHAQSRLIMKNFLTQTYSPISAASSEEIKELTWTSRAVLTRSETHSKQWIRYDAPLFTVLALSWNFITVATWQPSCTAQNVGAWRRRIYQNSPHFRPRAYAFSGPISS